MLNSMMQKKMDIYKTNEVDDTNLSPIFYIKAYDRNINIIKGEEEYKYYLNVNKLNNILFKKFDNKIGISFNNEASTLAKLYLIL